MILCKPIKDIFYMKGILMEKSFLCVIVDGNLAIIRNSLDTGYMRMSSLTVGHTQELTEHFIEELYDLLSST